MLLFHLLWPPLRPVHEHLQWVLGSRFLGFIFCTFVYLYLIFSFLLLLTFFCYLPDTFLHTINCFFCDVLILCVAHIFASLFSETMETAAATNSSSLECHCRWLCLLLLLLLVNLHIFVLCTKAADNDLHSVGRCNVRAGVYK